MKFIHINWQLIIDLTVREIIGRYKGSMLGIIWSLINPVLMLIIYTFVFSYIFQARWNNDISSRSEFALLLFCGLIIFNFFSECANRAPSLILCNTNYVKKVVFPLEVLPIVSTFSAFFQLLVSILVWFAFYSIEVGFPKVTSLLFPFVIIPLLFIGLGVGYFLSALGVYFRDINHLVSIIVTAMMFLSPIFYPESAVPERYLFLIKINPLAEIISFVRDIFYWGIFPNIFIYFIGLIMSFIFFVISLYFFRFAKKGFSDVL